MTDMLRRPSFRSPAILRYLLGAAFVLCAPLVSALKLPIDAGIDHGAHPALGISDEFGRWNSTIQLVYDPDGAPAAYSQPEKLLALVREAYEYWMQVCGVRFEIVGTDAAADDDGNFMNPDLRDGLVRISWGAIGGAAGRAGPRGDWFDENLGYFPYHDGGIELNNGAGVIESDSDLVNVLVHEIGHLLGLGHSDNPDSVMYANPYNFLRYPRADDIRAVQVMYGQPAVPVDPDSPVEDWLYSAPPLASAAARQFLFNSGAQNGAGNWFEIDDETVSSVPASTADDEFVWFGGRFGGSSTVVLDANFVVVDPSGYVYDEREWTGNCNPNFICTSFVSVAQARVMKTRPGNWSVYVVDRATNRTLASASIAVTTAVSFNQAPTATLTAVPGNTASQARFTLTATDPEGSSIDLLWYPPGPFGSQFDTFASGGSATRTIDFAQSGTHTFYAELRDRSARYGDGLHSSAAGEGFQTLLRITVSLPAATVQVLSTQPGSSVPATPDTSQQVLLAIAKNAMPQSGLVANSGGTNLESSASIGFTYGASSDQGLTTKTSFNAGDSVIIAGGIQPQAADLGKAADVFIVVCTTINGVDTWRYRNANGVFEAWPSVSIAMLQPAYSVSSLQTNQAFEIHDGSLVAAQHRVYIGYRVSGSTTLYYSGQAHSLNVSN